MGGAISDALYRRAGSLWAKKLLITGCGILTGVFLLAIGLTDPTNRSTMFGLVAGAAIFIEAGNGANFSLVPHVHPYGELFHICRSLSTIAS
jgi:MFS transporter, NNP family, nitrate/nitrite transporter